MDKDRVIARANKILEIAKNMVKGSGWRIESIIDEIYIHTSGYAEPGYECNVAVATGDWSEISYYNNKTHKREHLSDVPERLMKIFEKMGITCEWSDQWTTCEQCGKLIRNVGDSYSWMFHGFADTETGEVTCGECVIKDPENYFKFLENNPEVANTIEGLDPSDHGYIPIEDKFATGWYPGQTDDPHKIANEMNDLGIYRFLFHVTSVGQFDTHWKVYVHESM